MSEIVERLARLEEKTKYIEQQVSNDLPHQIEELGRKVELTSRGIEDVRSDIVDMKQSLINSIQSLSGEVQQNRVSKKKLDGILAIHKWLLWSKKRFYTSLFVLVVAIILLTTTTAIGELGDFSLNSLLEALVKAFL